MFSRAALCKRYLNDAEQFTTHALFRTLETGAAGVAGYDNFLRRVARAHLHAPHVSAFLYSVAPPDASARIGADLLEAVAMQVHCAGRVPALEAMLDAAGLGPELPALRTQGREDFERMISGPVPFGSLAAFGLALMIEAVAFDFLYDRMGRRMGELLLRYRELPGSALAWFIRGSGSSRTAHGLNHILCTIEHYRLETAAVEAIVDTVLIENLFVRRYFGKRALPGPC
jgi:hypothetical protein